MISLSIWDRSPNVNTACTGATNWCPATMVKGSPAPLGESWVGAEV